MESNIKKMYESEFKSFISNKIEAIRHTLAKKNKYSLGTITFVQRIAHKANFKLNNTIVVSFDNSIDLFDPISIVRCYQ